MQERRRTKRTEMKAELIINRLDTEVGEEGHRSVNIEVFDLSKGGLGFYCTDLLQIGAVYEVNLAIWTKEVLHTFLRVVRIELYGEGFHYGAVFIGLSEVDAGRIGVYQSFNDNSNE